MISKVISVQGLPPHCIQAKAKECEPGDYTVDTDQTGQDVPKSLFNTVDNNRNDVAYPDTEATPEETQDNTSLPLNPVTKVEAVNETEPHLNTTLPPVTKVKPLQDIVNLGPDGRFFESGIDRKDTDHEQQATEAGNSSNVSEETMKDAQGTPAKDGNLSFLQFISSPNDLDSSLTRLSSSLCKQQSSSLADKEIYCDDQETADPTMQGNLGKNKFFLPR